MGYWLLVFLWMGVIFFLSSVLHLETSLFWNFSLRKCAHILKFFILCFLFVSAFSQNFSFPVFSFKFLIFSVCLSFVCAITDEFYQRFVPGRYGCARDVLLDTLSILLFVGLAIKKPKDKCYLVKL